MVTSADSRNAAGISMHGGGYRMRHKSVIKTGVSGVVRTIPKDADSRDASGM